MPSVTPGYLFDLLPNQIPESPEKWEDILADISQTIMPGLTHWQSPNMHAYYPTATSFPSIVGEMISSGLGVIGFSWVCQDLNHVSGWYRLSTQQSIFCLFTFWSNSFFFIGFELSLKAKLVGDYVGLVLFNKRDQNLMYDATL